MDWAQYHLGWGPLDCPLLYSEQCIFPLPLYTPGTAEQLSPRLSHDEQSLRRHSLTMILSNHKSSFSSYLSRPTAGVSHLHVGSPVVRMIIIISVRQHPVIDVTRSNSLNFVYGKLTFKTCSENIKIFV